MVPDDDYRDDAPEPESGPPTVHDDAVRFWLEYRSNQLELRTGGTVVGRSAECQLVLDDAQVSRRHARFVRDTQSVVLEDLDSANGVFVNGERISKRRDLSAGDEIVIGQQRLVLHSGVRFRQPRRRDRFLAETLSGLETHAMIQDGPAADAPESDSTHQGRALNLLGGVADKVLALGRHDEAERILGAFLDNLVKSARGGQFPDADTARNATQYAVKLARVTGRPKWVDFCVELYTLLREPMPADVIDELYSLLRSVREVNQNGLRLYLRVLHARQDNFGPAERFLVQRIEGLERLAKL